MPGERRRPSVATLLVRALELWRGPPLAEFAFEDWAQAEIRRLGELRLVAVEERIEADIELGHPADVVSELESLTTEHPLRERLWYLRMLALHRSGRTAEALQAYTTARAALDELGLEPGEQPAPPPGRDPAGRGAGIAAGRTGSASATRTPRSSRRSSRDVSCR